MSHGCIVFLSIKIDIFFPAAPPLGTDQEPFLLLSLARFKHLLDNLFLLFRFKIFAKLPTCVILTSLILGFEINLSINIERLLLVRMGCIFCKEIIRACIIFQVIHKLHW